MMAIPGHELASPQEETVFDRDRIRQTVPSKAGVLDIDLPALGSDEPGLAVCARSKLKDKRPAVEKNMILTYSTLFLASLIVAMLTVFFLRLILHSSRSASRARKKHHQANSMMPDQNSQAWRKTVDNVTTRSGTQTSPAMPAGNYNQNGVWPYREEKHSSLGAAYKVRRKVAGDKPGVKYARTPWGW